MLLLLVNVSVALAQGQLDSRQTLTRTPSAAGVTYSYSYADAEGRSNRAQIFFSKLTVQIAGLGVPTPQVVQEQLRVLHDQASEHVFALLSHRATELSRNLPKGTSLHVEKTSEGIEWSLRGTVRGNGGELARLKSQNQQVFAELSQFHTELTNESPAVVQNLLRRGITNRPTFVKTATARWFSTNGLIEDHVGKKSYRPNYVTITRNFTPLMLPVSLALARPGDDPQKFLGRALVFFQAIPYSTLGTGNDAEGDLTYLTPLAVIDLNRGDCDSKSVALAATLKARYPPMGVILLLLPNHALMGVSLPAAPGQATYDHLGRRYVLMEPAGPARSAVGCISEDSAKALKKRELRQLLVLP